MVKQLKQYDVVLVDFGSNIDSEQSGKRPSVVIQNDTGNFFSPTTLVIPLTTSLKHMEQPTHALIAKGHGGSLYYSAKALKECGVGDIYAYATHTENSVLDKDKGTLINLLEDGTVTRLYTTDSLFAGNHEKITVMEVDGLI